MKKTLRALAALAAAFALTLTACQAQPAAAVDTVQPAPSSQAAESAPGPAQEEGSHILIAYFSVPETDGVDTVSGASRVVVEGDVLGNNQYIAQLIHQETGGDLFRIETVQAYPGTHSELLAFGHDEQASGRSLPPNPKTWTATMWSFWAIPSGTPTCPCRSTPSWRAMT